MARPKVIDTSTWIEWLIGSSRVRGLRSVLLDRENCVVPTIVQLELSKWLVRERGEDEADQVIAYTNQCRVILLDTTLALLASDMHREHKLATADAIVYATAVLTSAELITFDAHFRGLPQVMHYAK